MARLEARPTEYRGVRFRSKCEAMFALWLDLSEQPSDVVCEQWEYEPALTYMPGFSCDFHMYSLVKGSDFRPGLRQDFYEYKPSKPTQTYVDNYFKKYVGAMVFCDTKGMQDVSRASNAYIYYGSIFTNDRGRFFLDGPDVACIDETDWLAEYADSIRSYRFDLAVQAS